MAKKNDIHIKKSKRGTFTKAAKKRGKGVQEFAKQVLSNKDNYSSSMVKKANFARNASKWKKAFGGEINPMSLMNYGQQAGNLMGDMASSFTNDPRKQQLHQTALKHAGFGLPGMALGLFQAYNQRKQFNEQDQQQRQFQNQMISNQMQANQPTYTPAFPMGGLIPYSNAEIEKEEVVQTPGGNIQAFDGPSHAQGGIDINAPSGSRVFSDRLKPKGSKKTYAELADELRRKIQKYEKILNS